MLDLLFDTPYWLLGLLAVVGGVLWYSGNARREKGLQIGGYVVFLLAVLLGVLSYLVDTDKEKVIRRTHAIVAAVEKKDKTAAANLLHARASLAGMKKQAIVDRIGSAVDQFGIKGVRITSIDVQKGMDNEMTAAVAATADMEVGGYSGGVPSTWDLVWEKTADKGWLLRDITPKSVPGMDVQTLIGRLEGLGGFAR